MKIIALEDIMADTIVSFYENAAELGCPRDDEVDMWFRNLTDEERSDIMSKLLNIQDRDEQIKQEDKQEDDSKDIVMKEITLDLDDDIVEGVIEFARSKIVNDKQALINYGVNLILKEIVDKNGTSLDY